MQANLCTQPKRTQMVSLHRTRILTILSSEPPLIPPHLLTSQIRIGSSSSNNRSSSSRVLAFDYKYVVILKQQGEILGEKMSGILGGIKVSGMTGQRGTTTNGANISRSSIHFCAKIRIGHSRWQSFNDQRRVVNTTPSTTAHFLRLRTPAHAVAQSLSFLRGSSHQGSRIDKGSALSLCGFERSLS